MENIKTLRLKLETPMISDKDVEKMYNIDSMLKGSILPSTSYNDNVVIVNMVRTMIHNYESFLISQEMADVAYEYYVMGKTNEQIVCQKRLNLFHVRQIVCRIKRKAERILNNEIKLTDKKRIKESSFEDSYCDTYIMY